jgi:predicted nucleotidyltransferase
MLLFRSQLTRKLLNFFFLNPEENVHVNELARRLDVDKRNLVKKIKELEKEGLLKSEEKANAKLIGINTAHPFFPEYRRLFLKTSGLELTLKKALEKVQGVEKAFLFGSYARDTMSAYSDVDLMVVGHHSILSAQAELNKIQKQTGRVINVVNISPKEWQKKIRSKDSFYANLLKGKTIGLVG